MTRMGKQPTKIKNGMCEHGCCDGCPQGCFDDPQEMEEVGNNPIVARQMNLAEALAKEIQRNRELLEEYRKIPTGWFGASMIDLDIKNAVAALANDDVIKMLQAYEAMKNNK